MTFRYNKYCVHAINPPSFYILLPLLQSDTFLTFIHPLSLHTCCAFKSTMRGLCRPCFRGTKTSKTPMGPLTNFNKVSFQKDVFGFQIAVKDSPKSQRSKQEVWSTPRPPLVYRNSSSSWAVPLGNHSSFTTICCQRMTAYWSFRSSKSTCEVWRRKHNSVCHITLGALRDCLHFKIKGRPKRNTSFCPMEMI